MKIYILYIIYIMLSVPNTHTSPHHITQYIKTLLRMYAWVALTPFFVALNHQTIHTQI